MLGGFLTDVVRQSWPEEPTCHTEQANYTTNPVPVAAVTLNISSIVDKAASITLSQVVVFARNTIHNNQNCLVLIALSAVTFAVVNRLGKTSEQIAFNCAQDRKQE